MGELQRAVPPMPARDVSRDAPLPEHKNEQSPAMREYEARRCHVCQARYPAFGFGPPLTRAGHEVWACRAHRDIVASLLTRKPQDAAAQHATLF